MTFATAAAAPVAAARAARAARADGAVAAIGGFDLRRVLARGRQSTVYLASRGGSDVALKVAAGADYTQEGWLLQQLAGEHVIGVHGHGRCAAGGWLALELATGGSLDAPPAQPLQLAAVRRRLADAARALAHVHRLGWVHRDVKPANLLVRADGRVVLGDFGSACPLGTAAPRGQVVGTPLFASPELADAAPASPAMDIYALGAVLHQWLTGRPPFSGATLPEQAAQHLFAPVPVLPRPLWHWQPLLDAMLHKDPAQRPADAQAVLHRMPA